MRTSSTAALEQALQKGFDVNEVAELLMQEAEAGGDADEIARREAAIGDWMAERARNARSSLSYSELERVIKALAAPEVAAAILARARSAH